MQQRVLIASELDGSHRTLRGQVADQVKGAEWPMGSEEAETVLTSFGDGGSRGQEGRHGYNDYF